MSVYYTVKEHLTVNNVSEYNYPVSTMAFQLSLLGAMLLCGEAYVYSIRLTADGERYSFSGKEVNSDYQNIINVIYSAEKIDLVAEYGVTWRIGKVNGRLTVGHEAMCMVMDEALREDPSLAENCFYSSYCKADCGEGNGWLRAYGMKNGKLYNGDVEYTEIAEFPDDGVWHSESPSVYLYIENPEGYDMKVIDSLCKEIWDSFYSGNMYALSFKDGKVSTGEKIDPQTFIEDGFGLEFSLSDAQLKSADDFKKLINLYDKLNELSKGECGYLFEFDDCSGDDVRLIKIEYDEDTGKPVIKLAEI